MPTICARLAVLCDGLELGDLLPGDYPTRNHCFVASDSGDVDRIFRSMLRVRRWNFHFLYTKEMGHLDDSGNFVSETSSTIDEDVGSADPSFGAEGAQYVRNETQLTGDAQVWPAADAADAAQGHTLALNLVAGFSPSLQAWFLVFNGAASLAADRPRAANLSAYFSCNAADLQSPPYSSDGDVQNVFGFLGQNWPLVCAPTVVRTGDGDGGGGQNPPAERFALTALELTPAEYWSYGGTYDTATGTPA